MRVSGLAAAEASARASGRGDVGCGSRPARGESWAAQAGPMRGEQRPRGEGEELGWVVGWVWAGLVWVFLFYFYFSISNTTQT